MPLLLALVRLRLSAVFAQPLALPANAGPLLRSVFGAALRQGACSTGAPSCDGCPLLRGCAYPALFRTPPRDTQFDQRFSEVPNPYVIEPPALGARLLAAGEPLHWHMVLIGADAQRRLPLVLAAWQRALHNGLGPRRVRGELSAPALIADTGCCHPLTAADVQRAASQPAVLALPPAPAHAAAAQLHFQTPLRLQHNGRPLSADALSPRLLASHLLRRCNLMLDLHLGIRPAPFDAPALVALAETLSDDRSLLQWHDGSRWSARQQRDTPLGGLLGRWTLRGSLSPLLPWLWLGQWLHLGKGATQGLGGYTLRTPADAAEP